VVRVAARSAHANAAFSRDGIGYTVLNDIPPNSMFESAETGHAIDKDSYERELPALREALLSIQYELLRAGSFPVLILINGVDGAGKGETVNLLKEWMDPRHILVHALAEATEEERRHPLMWRFWRALPPRGHIGIFFGSWYTLPILARVHRDTRTADLDQAMDRNVRFERMLTDEGALIIKFWFHLSKDRQKTRLQKLAKDPATRWRVTKRDWQHFKLYDRFYRVAERALRQTSTAEAPWHIVEGTDARYRSLTVGRILREALRRRLDAPSPAPPAVPAPRSTTADERHLLRTLDLTRKLDKRKYERELERHQGALNLLTRHKKFHRHAVVAVFEGWDAAGKGSAIRRVTNALDARQYHVYPVAAPTEEERAQPYLWRFWRHVPHLGDIAIFDRSWYGRVLVERVEGLCAEHDWQRAYGEINDFEEQLVRDRAVLAKFWLQISPEEQLRRFQEREQIAFKRFKITPEDWRNREKRPLYEQAVCDMIDRTSTEIAPWTLVEAEDKRYARIRVLKTLCERIEEAL
jgi:polyphosphate:AMP phosphotransferase